MAGKEVTELSNNVTKLIDLLLNLTMDHSPEKPLENWQPFNLYCARLYRLLDSVRDGQFELSEEQVSALAVVMTRVSERKHSTVTGLLDYYGGAKVVEFLEHKADCEKRDAVRKILLEAVELIQLRRKNRQSQLEQKPNTNYFIPLRKSNTPSTHPLAKRMQAQ